jgi:hypothetical protein
MEAIMNDVATVPALSRVRRHVLLGGPLLSMLAAGYGLGQVGVPDEWLPLMLWTALVVAWSPLFFSVPALLLQDARDQILVGEPVWRRAVGLLPGLLAAQSPVRHDQLLSLYGFMLAALWLLR